MWIAWGSIGKEDVVQDVVSTMLTQLLHDAPKLLAKTLIWCCLQSRDRDEDLECKEEEDQVKQRIQVKQGSQTDVVRWTTTTNLTKETHKGLNTTQEADEISPNVSHEKGSNTQARSMYSSQH